MGKQEVVALKAILYGLWAVLYGICAGLGFVEPETALQTGAMTTASVLFFLPPAVLVAMAYRQKDGRTLRGIRYLSIASLGLTLVGFVINIGAVNASDSTGLVLYRVLNLLSVPMVCSRHYVLSLFLWSCLLFASFPKLVKKTL